MKQLLITLVAVVLGITAMSSYAEGDRKLSVGDKPVNVLESKGDNKSHSAQPYLESDSHGDCRSKHDCPPPVTPF